MATATEPITDAAREAVEGLLDGVTPREEPAPIHVLLGRILAELPAIGKTQRNVQQNFDFRGHDDVMNALNPLLAKYGVFVMPFVLERVTDQRTTSKGSTMYEVNLHVRFRFYGPAGDYVEASGWGEGTDMGDKSTSKAMTMAFKYVLAAVLAISTAETIDTDGTSVEETVRGGAAAAPAGNPFEEALGKLTVWVGDPKPWAAEARKALWGDKSGADVTAEMKRDLGARLVQVAENLVAVYPDAETVNAAVAAGAGEELRTAVRAAFSAAFESEIAGPDPFDPPIPF